MQSSDIRLSHESDPYINHHPCDYCGKSNIYTRFFVNRKNKQQKNILDIENQCAFLCYNCGGDYLDKNIGWELYENKVQILKQ